MKVWQLYSVVSGELDLVKSLASSRADWKFLEVWYDQINHLIDRQDRDKLDTKLPDDFVRAVLDRVDLKYFIHKGDLVSGRIAPDDICLTALEAFNKYGGEALEQALERGRYRVT